MSEISLPVPLPTAPDPTLQQRKASAPDHIVWVSASAGSGKTTVLTNRVLRLLLPDPQGRYGGTPPHRLLCITYTKAAAAEMALRVQKNLSDWAIMPEGELFKRLADLTGHDPDAAMLAAARKLFATVLDCPGGLKFLTIHSFCQSVLSRFPLEAGITPDFSVLDDMQAKTLFGAALEDILLQSQTAADGDIAAAFRQLAPFLQLDDLRNNIRAVLRQPEQVEAVFAKQQTLVTLTAEIRTGLGLPPQGSLTDFKQYFVASIGSPALRAHITPLINSGGAAARTMGEKLQAWVDLPDFEKANKLSLLENALLTSTNPAPRKLGKFVDAEPEAAAAITALTEQLLTYQDETKLLQQANATAALLVLSRHVLGEYENRKRRIGAMDYDDLIRKTDELLEKTSGTWVHYKLDGGIDHILMDEAQDTNPHQWNIIKNLGSEIFDGAGRDQERPRSLFIVGDEKQSIFSFQGADPVSFDRMRAYFEDRSRQAERDFVRVPLEVSFRTTAPVLKLVDTVFASAELRERIGLDPDQTLRHYSRRSEDAGLVELWPLHAKPEKTVRGQWELPFARQQDGVSGSSLAEQIAQEIWGWLQKKEILPSQNRPIAPGDILILVRTRDGLARDLIRQLKRRGLPVSGIDRLILGDQIGVQDLLALARFSRLPADDFSLACILRSPLIALSEEALMNLALERKDRTLWEHLSGHADPALVAWLSGMIVLGQNAAPFEFFEAALNRACPAAPQGTGWRAMTARLGEDVIDPLEELMSLSLRLEDQGVRTLDSLILWQQKTPVEIKREMEEAGNQIRLMTVHASKGLEAPIVILPDTTTIPARTKTERFIWPGQSGLKAPLWSPGKAAEGKAFAAARDLLWQAQHDEYARLLYVALTRARDRLYVMGKEGVAKTADQTWYGLIAHAFARLEGVETLENGRLRLTSLQKTAPHSRPAPALKTASPDVPLWVNTPPAQDETAARMFSPSQSSETALPVQSPLSPHQPYRFRRGTITHKLLQILPDLPDAGRDAAARHYVEKTGRDLPADIRQEIVAETLAVLRDPEFAPVFGPGSVAEIPLTGRLSDGRIINGQIDRLVITPGVILIVDYKTNRPSPTDPANIPEIYRNQLRSYRDALALIYPNYLINCALLWTDQPLLMPVAI